MHIVIIDDSQMNVMMIRKMLSSLEDCSVEEFTAPLPALAWCTEHEPDLILLDYLMPDMDGLEFIQAFRKLPERSEIPIVMVTTSDVREVRYQALEFGATDFLNKPVDKIELLARTRNMLALRRSQKVLQGRAAWLADEVRKATDDLVRSEREAILRLSKAAEYRDPETGSHLLRMACYSRLIAERLGLEVEAVELIHSAAPMHDVGKVGIADSILLKPGRLTPDEFTIMKRHAEIGYDILKDSPSRLLQCAARIALSHHEKFDGGGYPNGLAGTDIPLEGRIIAVADVFDALTSERIYKRAWSVEDARNLLVSNRGSHFDPACVDAFLGAWDQVMAIRDQYIDQPDPMLSDSGPQH